MAVRASVLKLVGEVGMAQGGEEFGEHETETLGRILETGPAGGGEELGSGGLQVAQVGEVATGALVGGGVEFEVTLVLAPHESDGEGRTVAAVGEAVLNADGKTKTKKRIVGRAGVEPVSG